MTTLHSHPRRPPASAGFVRLARSLRGGRGRAPVGRVGCIAQALDATRRAFDSVAATYDGPLGNNLLVNLMVPIVLLLFASRRIKLGIEME